MKAKISQGQGQLLLTSSASFVPPERLGDTAYNVAERAIAVRCVAALYKELRSRSPILQGIEKKLMFGPAENWKDTGPMSSALIDQDKAVEISLDEDALEGVYWCLLVMLFPQEKTGCAPAGQQEDILWPLADRLRLRTMLERTLGIFKAKRIRIDLDEIPEHEKSKEDTK